MIILITGKRHQLPCLQNFRKQLDKIMKSKNENYHHVQKNWTLYVETDLNNSITII